MRTYYTLGDTRYLPNICALLDSMFEKFSKIFEIYVLALDANVEKFISLNYDSNSVKVINLEQINEDFEIRSTRFLPPSQEAISNASASNKDPGFVQYCWSLSSCFGKWLMERKSIPLTYIDADIMFFSDIEPFFEELEDASIGVIRHRIPYLYTSGEYNVGIVHFKNDGPGKSALNRWSNLMMNPNNQYSLGFGTCGDQKYLELLQLIYKNDFKVVDENFGHLAPWNVTMHQYNNGKIIWQKREQELSYVHFAHFTIQPNGYRASYANEWIWGDPLKIHPFVNFLYDEYYKKIIYYIEEIKKCN
jgi:hypothetical protein